MVKSHREERAGRSLTWEELSDTDSGGWEDSNDPASPFDHGDGHEGVFGDRYVVLPEGTRTQRKVRKRPRPSSHETTDSGPSSKDTALRSASPVSDGSGGGNGAGSSGKETAPPSASPVANGSGGGEEADPSESDEDVFGPMRLKEWREYQKKRRRQFILQQSFPTTTSFSGPSTSASLDPGNGEEVSSSSVKTTGSSASPVSMADPPLHVEESNLPSGHEMVTRSIAKAAIPWDEGEQYNQCPLE